MRARLRRPSLLVKFSVLSLVLIAALGVALSAVLHSRIQHRALTDAMHMADVMTRVGVAADIERVDLSRPMPAARLDELDDRLRRSDFSTLAIRQVNLYNRRGQIVYSSDRDKVGELHEPSDEFRRALGGKVAGDVEEGEEEAEAGTRNLEVYVPVRLGPLGRTPSAVFEVYLRYEPVAKAIAEDSRRVYVLLGFGLALLYATLFRIVAAASRRLRHQALHAGLTDLPNRTLLYDRIADALAAARPGALVSEHTVIADPRRALGVLETVRELGVHLSLDDFGTGHSSLAYLKSLPLDEVKIDRSFVMGMAEDGDDAAIVRSTIDLASLACDVAQGFYLSRPLPADELRGWIDRRVTPSA